MVVWWLCRAGRNRRQNDKLDDGFRYTFSFKHTHLFLFFSRMSHNTFVFLAWLEYTVEFLRTFISGRAWRNGSPSRWPHKSCWCPRFTRFRGNVCSDVCHTRRQWDHRPAHYRSRLRPWFTRYGMRRIGVCWIWLPQSLLMVTALTFLCCYRCMHHIRIAFMPWALTLVLFNISFGQTGWAYSSQMGD